MPGNSVIRDKTNERHGLFWGIESCDVTHYSAPTARRQHSESRYGTLKVVQNRHDTQVKMTF